MNKMTGFCWVLALVLLAVPASAQVVENTYNFDDGTMMGFAKITRYDDDPTVVTSDTDFPAAFPPVSGSYAIRISDEDSSYWGLCSAIGGATFDRTAGDFVEATLRAEIYCSTSTSTTEHNFALLAIDDTTNLPGTESYYRLGYRNDEIFLQKFNGSAFTILGQDADLDASLTLDGWNTFQMRFDGASSIECSVNGSPASFSPVTDTEASINAAIQVGVLGFNFTSFDPILADNIYESIEHTSTAVLDWKKY